MVQSFHVFLRYLASFNRVKHRTTMPDALYLQQLPARMPALKKRYIVRKYVMASSAAEALRIEKTTRPDDVWVDEEWKRMQDDLQGAKVKRMGFDR